MNKIVSVAVAGALAAATIGATASTAAAGNGWRNYDGPRHGHHHRGPGPGPGLAAGALFGFFAGAIASQAFSPPPVYYPPVQVYYPPAPPVYPVYPVYGNPNTTWCAQEYRSYNPQTNTWVDFQGVVRVCYGPY